MIAVDTNVVLRYLLQDDVKQSSKASKQFMGHEKILITDVVLVETIWTLRGKRYALSKEALIEVIHSLIEEPNVVWEDGHAVWCALDDFVNAKPIKVSGKTKQADFADALIVNKSQRYGINKTLSVFPLYTFDKAALEINGTKEPK
ncbi:MULTISPECIES: PIN domain-containing protein [Marinobacter]|uniref:Type II toxin-antitoxin system VapC family toxin n=1 Tax=Marinobacter metalliresistant TaxID=2961995 RepID=A0ABZ2VXR1_9GAMM|nr:type II toxin-antitoxin system VapC family toxin [Marinobacter sp. Arc7-DN-1]AXS83760.1 PIN domain-containing protein [Marinobacter sp. Arc7-DN-1]